MNKRSKGAKMKPKLIPQVMPKEVEKQIMNIMGIMFFKSKSMHHHCPHIVFLSFAGCMRERNNYQHKHQNKIKIHHKFDKTSM